jgi:BirA family transcriptional regulator, biotin operon repressor / biotin---[acetyl-CoA-carboxylase] ligase
VLAAGSGWRRLDVVAETGSTNADLIAGAMAGEDISGAVLIAEYQTAGRGGQGRTWFDAPRAQIAMSVVSTPRTCPPTGGGGSRWRRRRGAQMAQ